MEVIRSRIHIRTADPDQHRLGGSQRSLSVPEIFFSRRLALASWRLQAPGCWLPDLIVASIASLCVHGTICLRLLQRPVSGCRWCGYAIYRAAGWKKTAASWVALVPIMSSWTAARRSGVHGFRWQLQAVCVWSRRAPAVGTVRDRWSLINRTTTTDRPVLWLLTKLQCRFERWAEGGHTLCPPPENGGPIYVGC